MENNTICWMKDIISNFCDLSFFLKVLLDHTFTQFLLKDALKMHLIFNGWTNLCYMASNTFVIHWLLDKSAGIQERGFSCKWGINTYSWKPRKASLSHGPRVALTFLIPQNFHEGRWCWLCMTKKSNKDSKSQLDSRFQNRTVFTTELNKYFFSPQNVLISTIVNSAICINIDLNKLKNNRFIEVNTNVVEFTLSICTIQLFLVYLQSRGLITAVWLLNNFICPQILLYPTPGKN